MVPLPFLDPIYSLTISESKSCVANNDGGSRQLGRRTVPIFLPDESIVMSAGEAPRIGEVGGGVNNAPLSSSADATATPASLRRSQILFQKCINTGEG
jgi:hypothetical protein